MKLCSAAVPTENQLERPCSRVDVDKGRVAYKEGICMLLSSAEWQRVQLEAVVPVISKLSSPANNQEGVTKNDRQVGSPAELLTRLGPSDASAKGVSGGEATKILIIASLPTIYFVLQPMAGRAADR